MTIGINSVKLSYLKILRTAAKFKDESYKYYFLNKCRRMFRDGLEKNKDFEQLLYESSELEKILSRQAGIFNLYNDFSIEVEK